jgi:hypothetical protein
MEEKCSFCLLFLFLPATVRESNCVSLHARINKKFCKNYCHTATSQANCLKMSSHPGGGRWVGGGSKLPNQGDFFKKSRQLLQEITATSAGNHGNFCRKSRQLLQLF